MDRRQFLSSGAGAAAALTAASASHAAVWLQGTPSAQPLSRADFERWLDSSFEVRRVGTMHSSSARLVAVQDGQHARALEQFHVILRGEDARATGLCELRHQGGTVLRLWLDAAGVDGEAPLMRATFSLIVPV